MSMMLRSLDRLDTSRRYRIFAAAERFLHKIAFINKKLSIKAICHHMLRRKKQISAVWLEGSAKTFGLGI